MCAPFPAVAGATPVDRRDGWKTADARVPLAADTGAEWGCGRRRPSIGGCPLASSPAVALPPRDFAALRHNSTTFLLRCGIPLPQSFLGETLLASASARPGRGLPQRGGSREPSHARLRRARTWHSSALRAGDENSSPVSQARQVLVPAQMLGVGEAPSTAASSAASACLRLPSPRRRAGQVVPDGRRSRRGSRERHREHRARRAVVALRQPLARHVERRLGVDPVQHALRGHRLVALSRGGALQPSDVERPAQLVGRGRRLGVRRPPQQRQLLARDSARRRRPSDGARAAASGEPGIGFEARRGGRRRRPGRAARRRRPRSAGSARRPPASRPPPPARRRPPSAGATRPRSAPRRAAPCPGASPPAPSSPPPGWRAPAAARSGGRRRSPASGPCPRERTARRPGASRRS